MPAAPYTLDDDAVAALGAAGAMITDGGHIHGNTEDIMVGIHPGRGVINIPGRTWDYTPATCPLDDAARGEWVLDDQFLVCPGCGLDCT